MNFQEIGQESCKTTKGMILDPIFPNYPYVYVIEKELGMKVGLGCF